MFFVRKLKISRDLSTPVTVTRVVAFPEKYYFRTFFGNFPTHAPLPTATKTPSEVTSVLLQPVALNHVGGDLFLRGVRLAEQISARCRVLHRYDVVRVERWQTALLRVQPRLKRRPIVTLPFIVQQTSLVQF